MDRRKAAFSTVEAIKDLILRNGLRPGDPIPTEAELCATLGVSRSSVREAIRTLASLDIVEVRHGRGTTVGQLSLSPFIDALAFRSLMNPDGTCATLLEVVDLREGIDLALSDELVALHRGRPDPHLRGLVDTMREQAANGHSFPDTDIAFHTALLSGSSNRLVQQLVAALWEVHTVTVPQLGIPQPDDIHDTAAAHGGMLDALEIGDVSAYRTAVKNHYAPLRRAIERAGTTSNNPASSSDTKAPTVRHTPTSS
ncbi:FadR/GntR family transcriptional regulator [Devriesea agamarum]|uniref:FadR/GntR family transcriptional regulator n=1 Tax=Devriesea agamarum TaxID=472569 RepID=UPI000A74FBCA|nr:GntR family transcriptional regulator [Devriesea agamarum]